MPGDPRGQSGERQKVFDGVIRQAGPGRMIIAKKRIAGKEQAYVRKYKQYSQHCKRSGGRR